MRNGMPIYSLHDVSNLPIEKTLIDFPIMNEVLKELNQSNKTIFTPCNEQIDVGNAVWDKNIQSLIPGFPNIDISCDVTCKILWITTIS